MFPLRTSARISRSRESRLRTLSFSFAVTNFHKSFCATCCHGRQDASPKKSKTVPLASGFCRRPVRFLPSAASGEIATYALKLEDRRWPGRMDDARFTPQPCPLASMSSSDEREPRNLGLKAHFVHLLRHIES